jgi:hypothetical protein
MNNYRDTPIKKLVDWEDADKLMQLWHRIYYHPIKSARELGMSISDAKVLKNKAANYALYLKLKGKDEERSQIYLRIYNDLCQEP